MLQCLDMRRIFTSLALAPLFWFVCAAAAPMSDQVVRYKIQAQLDAVKHAVTGEETLTWRNESQDAVGELRFHLYLNAFANEKSTFIRESGGQLRGDRLSKNGWGWIDVHRMRIEGGPDLTSAIRFIHPDDDNADDRTVIAVPLPKPVPPGGSITLQIGFLSQLPKVYARTGYRNDFHMVGQWFPKIGVYEKAGDRYAKTGGWNCHQFHADSEFYADYGVYDVTLTVPDNYVVGATGVRQSAVEDAARHTRTYRFYQEDVHDFSWTASPRFVRLEREFDPAREVKPAELAGAAKLLGLPEAALALRPVRMILLLQPEHVAQAERHFRAVANGIKWFGLWYGAYPYPTITVVDPPYGAGGAGGMEYPTLITAGTTWWPGANDGMIEEVTVHEFGHQYWYGMVGTNEFEEAWLDEGFNTYSTGKVLDAAYGLRDLPIHLYNVPVGRLLGLPRIDSDIENRSVYLFYGKHDPVVRNAWQFYGESEYAINSYYRTGTLLRTLENYLGAPVMARVMRAWFERYRFRHPDSLDFERLVKEVSGRDMTWFFDEFVFGTNALDYRVGSVDCEPVETKAGSYVENGRRRTETEDDAERADKERERKGGKEYRIVVRLVREGEAVFPVAMKMTLENGETVREQWDGRDRWIRYEYTRKAKVRSVEIDPDHKILLDTSFANNSWTAQTQWLPLAKWSSDLLFWLQMVLP